MLCDEFVDLMQAALDRRLRPEDDSLLQQHASECQKCERMLRVQQQLFEGLKDARPAKSNACISERVLREVGSGRRSQRSNWTLVATSLLAVGACCLLVLRPLNITSAPVRTAQPPLLAPGTAPPIAARDALPISAETFREALPLEGPLQDETPLTSLATHSEPDAGGWFFRELLEQISVAPFDELESVDQIAGSLRPIATTLNVAFDTLWRNIPGGTSPDRRTTPNNSAALPSNWLTLS